VNAETTRATMGEAFGSGAHSQAEPEVAELGAARKSVSTRGGWERLLARRVSIG
jgi:hypothetical protein